MNALRILKTESDQWTNGHPPRHSKNQDRRWIIVLDCFVCRDVARYNAPQSQVWLEQEPDLFVFGFEPNPECCSVLRAGSVQQKPGHGEPLSDKNMKRFRLVSRTKLNDDPLSDSGGAVECVGPHDDGFLHDEA